MEFQDYLPGLKQINTSSLISSVVERLTMFHTGGIVIRRGLDTPWRVVNEVHRRVAVPYIRILFRIYGITWGQNWRIFGMPIIQRHRGSVIKLGTGIELRSWRTSNPLVPIHPVVLATRTTTASIIVGESCGFTGTTLVAAERIEIGNRVHIGANATIVDTDFHPLDPSERQRDILNGQHRPVIIEDDVFIGMHSLILKGVTLGRGSVVGAGSVVTRDVPAGVVVAGNPAQIIRHLQSIADADLSSHRRSSV